MLYIVWGGNMIPDKILKSLIHKTLFELQEPSHVYIWSERFQMDEAAKSEALRLKHSESRLEREKMWGWFNAEAYGFSL